MSDQPSNEVVFRQVKGDGTLYQEVVFKQFYADRADMIEDGFNLVGAVSAAVTAVQEERAKKAFVEQLKRGGRD